MSSTDELLIHFELLLAQGFSIPNARRLIEREIVGTKELKRWREALVRWIAGEKVGDGISG